MPKENVTKPGTTLVVAPIVPSTVASPPVVSAAATSLSTLPAKTLKNPATRVIAPSTLNGVDAKIQKYTIFPYLDMKSQCRYGIVNRQLHGIFSQKLAELRVQHFQTLVARGEQQLAEVWLIAEKYQLTHQQVETILKKEIAAALEKGLVIITMPGVQKTLNKTTSTTKVTDSKTASKTALMTTSAGASAGAGASASSSTTYCSQLLQQKSKLPVMDWAEEEPFVGFTAFQIPVVHNDTHMYRMMYPHYLSQEQAHAQWEALKAMKEIKILNYQFLLKTADTIPKAEEIHFSIEDNCLSYSLVSLSGDIVLAKKIPSDIVPPPSLDAKEHLLDYVKKNSSKILRYTFEQLDTGKFMTRGCRKTAKVHHGLKTYVDHLDQWSEEKRIEYYRLYVSVAQKNSAPQLIQEYGRSDRSFKPTPKFDEETLPRKPKYDNGIPIYPLRIYKCVMVVKDIKDLGATPIDLHTVVLERKAAKITAYWNKDEKHVASKTLEEQAVLDFIHSRDDGLMLPPPGGESRARKLITLVLFKFNCDWGLGSSQTGLIRAKWGTALWSIGDDHSAPIEEAITDLAAVGSSCKVRSQHDLEKLEKDLSQKLSPSPSPSCCAIT